MTTARDELIDIQQRLVEELKENIYDTVGRNNVELDAYYRDYQLEFQRGYERLSTRDEIIQRLMRANIAYFGDYHTLRAAQTTVLDLLQGAAERGRKIVLAMEMIYAADKPQAQALMDGEIDDETYRWRVKWDNSWGFSWSSYKRFFAFCKEYDTPLFGLNINADKREYDDLHYRDMFSGELVSSLTQLYPERLVAVLYGDLHLAGNHLPAQVDASLAKYGAKRRSVRVYQNSETLYWQMVEQRLEHVVDYIKMRLDQYVVMNATPLVKFQSFANWQQRRQEIVWEGSDEVDLQAETALLDEVHHYVETIIAFLGIELEETANFELYTAADLDLLSSLVARGVYTAAEMDALKDYMSMAETAFFERARVLYIANFTVANAAEAAARYVLAEVRPTSNDAVDERDEFYARCMVEALAFFCSKIIDPRRHARGRESWEQIAGRYKGRRKLGRIQQLDLKAARRFLKHKEYEQRVLEEDSYRGSPRSMFGLPTDEHVSLTRALGRALGDRMFAALGHGVTKELIREAASDELRKPNQCRDRYFQMLRLSKDAQVFEPVHRGAIPRSFMEDE
ncbi:MAG: ChaN family lipoprotein [Planctomycetes bacterium]|nr:ChaN family lipoprotein [Planctomycetota bacterium]